MTEAAWKLPTDAAIMDNLVRRIERQRDGVGIVVGVIDRAPVFSSTAAWGTGRSA
ncbi:MAG: hypothetical protein ACHP84_21000 [Caulobacterales bacterium]